MKLFHILALLLTASAVFSYINHRFLKLPTVIGIMLVALVTGVYTLAETLHLSAPIAIVVAGLLIGNHGRVLAMSEKTRGHPARYAMPWLP